MQNQAQVLSFRGVWQWVQAWNQTSSFPAIMLVCPPLAPSHLFPRYPVSTLSHFCQAAAQGAGLESITWFIAQPYQQLCSRSTVSGTRRQAVPLLHAKQRTATLWQSKRTAAFIFVDSESTSQRLCSTPGVWQPHSTWVPSLLAQKYFCSGAWIYVMWTVVCIREQYKFHHCGLTSEQGLMLHCTHWQEY